MEAQEPAFPLPRNPLDRAEGVVPVIFVRDRPSNCQSGRVLRIVGEGQVLEAEEALKRVLRVGVQMRVDLQPSIVDILAQGVRVSLGKTLLVPLLLSRCPHGRGSATEAPHRRRADAPQETSWLRFKSRTAEHV